MTTVYKVQVLASSPGRTTITIINYAIELLLGCRHLNKKTKQLEHFKIKRERINNNNNKQQVNNY